MFGYEYIFRFNTLSSSMIIKLSAIWQFICAYRNRFLSDSGASSGGKRDSAFVVHNNVSAQLSGQGLVTLTFRRPCSPPTSHPPSATGAMHLSTSLVANSPIPNLSPVYLRHRTMFCTSFIRRARKRRRAGMDSGLKGGLFRFKYGVREDCVFDISFANTM